MLDPLTFSAFVKTTKLLSVLSRQYKTTGVGEIPAFVDYCGKINQVISLIILEIQKEKPDELPTLGAQLKAWSESNSFKDPVLKSHREKISSALLEIAERIDLMDPASLDTQVRTKITKNFKIIFGQLKGLGDVLLFENKISVSGTRKAGQSNRFKSLVEWALAPAVGSIVTGYIARGAENIPVIGPQLASFINGDAASDNTKQDVDNA